MLAWQTVRYLEFGQVRVGLLTRSTVMMAVVLFAGCSTDPALGAVGQSPVVPSPVVITAQAPQPTGTPVVCTSTPAGMVMSAKPVSQTELQLDIVGLEPGEKPFLVLLAKGETHTHTVEIHPAETVGVDGRFTYDVVGLKPLQGSARNEWEVKVVHSHGVACTQVSLP